MLTVIKRAEIARGACVLDTENLCLAEIVKVGVSQVKVRRLWSEGGDARTSETLETVSRWLFVTSNPALASQAARALTEVHKEKPLLHGAAGIKRASEVLAQIVGRT